MFLLFVSCFGILPKIPIVYPTTTMPGSSTFPNGQGAEMMTLCVNISLVAFCLCV